MKRAIPITTLFLDIGDVLLTDRWDHRSHTGGDELQPGVGREGIIHDTS
jgi:hypothetical protein